MVGLCQQIAVGYALDRAFEPPTHRVYDAFDWFPAPGDEHLCEYLPWLSVPVAKPWENYDVSLYEWDLWDQLRGAGHGEIARMGEREPSIDQLRGADSWS